MCSTASSPVISRSATLDASAFRQRRRYHFLCRGFVRRVASVPLRISKLSCSSPHSRRARIGSLCVRFHQVQQGGGISHVVVQSLGGSVVQRLLLALGARQGRTAGRGRDLCGYLGRRRRSCNIDGVTAVDERCAIDRPCRAPAPNRSAASSEGSQAPQLGCEILGRIRQDVGGHLRGGFAVAGALLRTRNESGSQSVGGRRIKSLP